MAKSNFWPFPLHKQSPSRIALLKRRERSLLYRVWNCFNSVINKATSRAIPGFAWYTSCGMEKIPSTVIGRTISGEHSCWWQAIQQLCESCCKVNVPEILPLLCKYVKQESVPLGCILPASWQLGVGVLGVCVQECVCVSRGCVQGACVHRGVCPGCVCLEGVHPGVRVSRGVFTGCVQGDVYPQTQMHTPWTQRHTFLVDRRNDTHLWKHYLPTTTIAGSKKSKNIKEWKNSTCWLILVVCNGFQSFKTESHISLIQV